MAEELIKVGKNEKLSRTAISLPAYTKITEQRVVKEMQALFKGFTFDSDMHVTEVFKNVEQVESFAKESIKEINNIDTQFKMDNIMKAGAIAVRRWYFGFVVNKCLSEASYGEQLAQKLAAASDISLAYLYQYREVGENLSITDAYTLGIYQASWDLIRKIATIDDPDMRTSIITMYTDAITDIDNVVEIEAARNAALSAISYLKQNKTDADSLDISNPKLLDQLANFETMAPEYVECKKAVEAMLTAIRKLTKSQNYEKWVTSLQDFFLMSDILNAENYLATLKGSVSDALTQIEKLENILPTYKQELQSVLNASLTTPEEAEKA